MCMEEYNLRDLFQQTSGGLRLAERKHRISVRRCGAAAGRAWLDAGCAAASAAAVVSGASAVDDKGMGRWGLRMSTAVCPAACLRDASPARAPTDRQESVWGVIFFEEHVEGLVSLERDSGGFGLGLFFSKRRVAAAIHSAES